MKKTLLTIASVISVLSLVPLFFLFLRLKEASNLMKADTAGPAVIDKILGYSIKTPDLLIPFIAIVIIFAIQAVIATYLLTKGTTRQEKVFGYLTFILGGLGLNAIYFVITLIINSPKSLRPRGVRGWATVSAIVISPIVMSMPIIGFAFFKGIDNPTHIKNISYSTNPSNQNVIEIFTDGFDPQYMLEKIQNNHSYDNFDVYPNFVVSGAETSYSLPTIMEGIETRNIFNQYDQATGATSMASMSASVFGTAISNHLSSNNVSAPEKYLINTNGIIEGGGFAASMSGDPEFMKRIDPTVKTVNWGQARNDLAGTVGTMNYSPERAYLAWHDEKAIADATATKGTRVLLQEFSTHSPRITGEDGGVTFKTGTENGIDVSVLETAKGLDNSLTAFIENLKTLKDTSGISVYDNSMIIIYGDHANHSTDLIHFDSPAGTTASKYNSMMMVKYPKANYGSAGYHTAVNVNTTQEIYAPFLNHIIKNIADPKFIEDDKFGNFAPGREFLGFYGEEAVYMKYAGSGADKVLMADKAVTIGATEGFLTYDEYKLLPGGQTDLLKDIIWKVSP